MADPRVVSLARQLLADCTVATATQALVAAQLLIDAAEELRGDSSRAATTDYRADRITGWLDSSGKSAAQA